MELPEKDISLQRESRREKIQVEQWLKNLLDVDKINPAILKRLNLLSSITNFIEEEKETIQYADRVFSYYENKKSNRIFDKLEKDTVKVGLAFADIGKSGPASANESQQALIIRLYNIEGVRDIKDQIQHFIRTRFPETAERDIELFKEMGLDPLMPIEKFWRLHSGWTLQIIEGDGIPKENLPSAALHHILEGDNIELMDEQGNFKTIVDNGEIKLRFGANASFDRAEKLVVLLDKYEAFLRRVAGMTHDSAIERLRQLLNKNQKYKNDPEFLELVDDVLVALK